LKKLLAIILAINLIAFAAHAETDKIRMSGTICPSCDQNLEKSFSELKAVDKVSVDIKGMVVTVKTKAGQILTVEDIKKTLNDNGLNLVSILSSNP